MSDGVVLLRRGTCRRISGRWFDVMEYGDGRVVVRQMVDVWPDWPERYRALQEEGER